MEFSSPGHWSAQLFPSPGGLPSPGIEPRSPTLQADSLPAEPPTGEGTKTLSRGAGEGGRQPPCQPQGCLAFLPAHGYRPGGGPSASGRSPDAFVDTAAQVSFYSDKGQGCPVRGTAPGPGQGTLYRPWLCWCKSWPGCRGLAGWGWIHTGRSSLHPAPGGGPGPPWSAEAGQGRAGPGEESLSSQLPGRGRWVCHTSFLQEPVGGWGWGGVGSEITVS